ncbi:MAG: hypothetical protein AMK69_06710 [Nitrospira bacterium SG8_3]|nr:MAG: hypothetical protein AMK69_06710 [Nitrospira bacterium SG8_3]
MVRLQKVTRLTSLPGKPNEDLREKAKKRQFVVFRTAFFFQNKTTEKGDYLFLCRIFFFCFLYLCFLIFLRRFFTTLPIKVRTSG